MDKLRFNYEIEGKYRPGVEKFLSFKIELLHKYELYFATSRVIRIKDRTTIEELRLLIPRDEYKIMGSLEKNYLFTNKENTCLFEITLSRNKKRYNAFLILYCRTYELLTEADKLKSILELSQNLVSYAEEINIKLLYKSSDSSYIDYKIVSQIFDETIHQEAYPYIDNLKTYINKYLVSDENVLLLMGPPGTGKTRFIRHLVKIFSSQYLDKQANELDDRYIAYSNSRKVLHSDELWIDFICGDYPLLVLEDVDYDLKPRTEGNEMMVLLLNASDGFISTRSQKLILSTNLETIDHIDKALIRSGRCFDILNFRKLTFEEAKILANILKVDLVKEKPKYSLAEIYNSKDESRLYEIKRIN